MVLIVWRFGFKLGVLGRFVLKVFCYELEGFAWVGVTEFVGRCEVWDFFGVLISRAGRFGGCRVMLSVEFKGGT